MPVYRNEEGLFEAADDDDVVLATFDNEKDAYLFLDDLWAREEDDV